MTKTAKEKTDDVPDDVHFTQENIKLHFRRSNIIEHVALKTDVITYPKLLFCFFDTVNVILR